MSKLYNDFADTRIFVSETIDGRVLLIVGPSYYEGLYLHSDTWEELKKEALLFSEGVDKWHEEARESRAGKIVQIEGRDITAYFDSKYVFIGCTRLTHDELKAVLAKILATIDEKMDGKK